MPVPMDYEIAPRLHRLDRRAFNNILRQVVSIEGEPVGCLLGFLREYSIYLTVVGLTERR